MASFACSVRKDWENKDGHKGIIITYSHEADWKKLPTNVFIDVNRFSFDKKNRLIVPLTNSLSKAEQKELEQTQSNLNKAINKLQDCVRLCEIQNENPSVERIQALYSKKPNDNNIDQKKSPSKNEKPNSTKAIAQPKAVSQNVFFWYEQKYLPAKEAEMGAGINSYRSTLTHLKACFPKEDLNFDDLNKENLDEFKRYLTKKKLEGTTIHKQFNNLKIFINWVELIDEENNIRIPKAYKKTKIKARYGSPIGLTFSQFMDFYKLDLGNRPELKRTRDVFVFGVSIGGPRHGDLQKIGKHLRENYKTLKDQGFNYFENKTGNAHMNITLNKFGEEILKEYNFEFPHVPSNYRMNQNLKTIAQLLEWNELKDVPSFDSQGRVTKVERIPLKEIFSTKFMRKTAISIDAALGVPVQIGMKRSGHTTFNSYKRYLDIDKDAMDKANSKWDKIFSQESIKKKKRGRSI